ncbi:DHH family phosphoesterase [Caldibacillus thermoamylovorans]|uniref:DHH family phosphoesterase n=1 Tax=Caldibacillus thermoamylovorans TaxID=35841 RepID=UPI00203B0F51|nr:DHH family phosphoesterase [Caldibacillus thermoamylovorans]MCM3478972.1 DHH family phosphoesterase [Caldibacillus thermoamylovorans]
MPIFLQTNGMKKILIGFFSVIFLLLLILAIYNWWLSAISIIILLYFFYLLIKQSVKFQKEVDHYISLLSHRVEKVGEEALLQMPIGILLVDEEYTIEWANPYMLSVFQEESLIGTSVYDIADELIQMMIQENERKVITLHERKYRVFYKREEKLLYFFDITEQALIEQKYEDEQPVIAIIFLDNYDEVTQGMDDLARGSLNSRVTSLLNEWASQYGIYLKRVSGDRFIAFFNEKILAVLEKGKFSILDNIREMTAKNNLPLTLSIGVGAGSSSLPELGSYAQSSLDLALGRGGDQAAIKLPNGKIKFYGGKTNPMEKRTRVRARVISHALSELIQDSDRIFIMGHKYPDMDAVGAAIGILKIAQMNQRESYVILNEQEIDSGVRKLLSEVKQKTDIYSHFISPQEALEINMTNALLVIVDTHKPSLVIEEKLVNRCERIVVIDHHRRSEEFVQNPLLVYMEPYASSTSELVTELLQYQPNRKIDILEATALLAGIIVDTKSFTLRTGSRTFDAASYLRAKGADTVLVQKFLREDLDTFIKRAKLVEKVEFYKEGIAITKGEPSESYNNVLIAQTADLLLAMENVEASFVISKRPDDMVGISARSLGKINVQIIMEQLEGGGHLTNAATQLRDITINEAEKQLKAVIDSYLEGGNQS